MVIYGIIDDNVGEDGSMHYATLKEAKQAARELANQEPYSEVTVNLYRFEPTKVNIIKLANDRGWASEIKAVYTAKPRKRSDT